jgi:hypothetical protein
LEPDVDVVLLEDLVELGDELHGELFLPKITALFDDHLHEFPRGDRAIG